MEPAFMPLKAKVVKKASSSASMFLELNPPIDGIKYAVMSEETKGATEFWSAIGTGNPVGREITILKMSMLGDAYDIEEIAPFAMPDFSSLCEVKDP